MSTWEITAGIFWWAALALAWRKRTSLPHLWIVTTLAAMGLACLLVSFKWL